VIIIIIIIIINQVLHIFYFYNYRFHANNYKFCQQFVLKRNLLIVCHVPSTVDPCVLFGLDVANSYAGSLGAITVADRTVDTVIMCSGFHFVCQFDGLSGFS
jgi:hypothetical protein